MSLITKPLLASPIEDLKDLKYPILLTKKIDGIRALIIDGKAVSRNFKNQPNTFIREYLSRDQFSGLDGELVLKGNKGFNDIQSEVMSFEGEPDFEYWVFDYVKDDLNKPYNKRMEDLEYLYKLMPDELKERIKVILPIEAKNEQELLQFEEQCLADGYEGVMIRSPEGVYKCGRSSVKQGILIKLKRFIDAESIIINFEERMHNGNVKEQDAFGRAKRSSHQENLVGMNTLGALVVQMENGLTFKIGTGFNDELRQEIWDNKEKYLGKLCTYKSQPTGVKDLPRFPVFKSVRDPADLD